MPQSRILTDFCVLMAALAASSCSFRGASGLTDPYPIETGVKRGIGNLQKELMYEWSTLAPVSEVKYTNLDGAPGDEVGVLTADGVTILTLDGRLKTSVPFNDHGWVVKIGSWPSRRTYRAVLPEIGFIDVEGDGVTEYFTRRDSIGDAVVLLGFDGSVRWTHAAPSRHGGYFVASADLDEDGLVEFVVQAWPDLWVLAADGTELWRTTLWPEGIDKDQKGFIWHPNGVYVVDVNRDGELDIVALVGGLGYADRILVIDRHGELSAEKLLPVRLRDEFGLVESIDGTGSLLLAGEDNGTRTFLVSLTDGTIQHAFPKASAFYASGTFVSFRPGLHSFVFARNRGFPHPTRTGLAGVQTAIFAFDKSDQIEYEEALPGWIRSMEKLALENQGEALLVPISGTPGSLWLYSAVQ